MKHLRHDQQQIAQWIKPGSKVLDLGCGNGTLLAYLAENKQTQGYGLEIDDANIVSCIEKGVNVIQRDIDEGLSEFDNDFFDYVILSQTIQAVRYPEKTLSEMLRVGCKGIVTLPNLGHWRIRAQIAFGGKTPLTREFPHSWYDTPNIHVCTIDDFEGFCDKKKVTIVKRRVFDDEKSSGFLVNAFPNLFSTMAVYKLCRNCPDESVSS